MCKLAILNVGTLAYQLLFASLQNREVRSRALLGLSRCRSVRNSLLSFLAVALSVSALPAVSQADWQRFAARPLSVCLAYALVASLSLQLPRLSAGLPSGLLLFLPLRCRFWVTRSWLAALVLARARSLGAISF